MARLRSLPVRPSASGLPRHKRLSALTNRFSSSLAAIVVDSQTCHVILRCVLAKVKLEIRAICFRTNVLRWANGGLTVVWHEVNLRAVRHTRRRLQGGTCASSAGAPESWPHADARHLGLAQHGEPARVRVVSGGGRCARARARGAAREGGARGRRHHGRCRRAAGAGDSGERGYGP